MIYKEHKLLFSAIPKTGTTTISSYINKFFKYETSKFVELDGIKDYHPSVWNIDAWIKSNKINMKNVFYCGLTRNPYDRFVSHYFYSLYVKECYDKYKCSPYGKKVLDEYKSEENLKKDLNRDSMKKETKNSILNNVFLSKPTEMYLQVDEVLRDTESFEDFVHKFYEYDYIETKFPLQIIFTHFAWNYQGPKLDFIGKYEELQNSFDFICEKIKIPSVALKKTNKSDHKNYPEYYNKDTQKIISLLYDMDFKYFGYSKDI